jgi:hypothetical protein
MPRMKIDPARLYAELDREFRANRSALCGKCRVPLPYYRAAPDEVSANWFIGHPTICPQGCHRVIAEVLAELWTRYDITPLKGPSSGQ